jgi:hypothetical protein
MLREELKRVGPVHEGARFEVAHAAPYDLGRGSREDAELIRRWS